MNNKEVKVAIISASATILTSDKFVSTFHSDESTKPTIEAKGGVIDCTISNVQINGSTATAHVTTTLGNGETCTQTQHLVLENGKWKINLTF